MKCSHGSFCFKSWTFHCYLYAIATVCIYHLTPSPSHFISLRKQEEYHIPASPIRYRFLDYGNRMWIKNWRNPLLSALRISLANRKRAFICFSLNRAIFFRLKAFHPLLVMYLYIYRYAQNFFVFQLKIFGNLSCWIVSFVFRFTDWISSTIGQNRQSSTSWFVLEAVSFRPLAHPTFRLVKKINDFFDWMIIWS